MCQRSEQPLRNLCILERHMLLNRVADLELILACFYRDLKVVPNRIGTNCRLKTFQMEERIRHNGNADPKTDNAWKTLRMPRFVG